MFVGVESFNREHSWRPRRIRTIRNAIGSWCNMCHAHGIGAHFSNIIGFPNDTEAAVLEHLRILRELQPDVASFDILTPLGRAVDTDFQTAGLISEPNLDRFDGTYPTWRHPHLTHERLSQACSFAVTASSTRISSCRRRISWAKMARWPQRGMGCRSLAKLSTERIAVFSRLAVAAGRHPMAGGVFEARCDGVSDYVDLRRRLYGFDLAPPAGLRPTVDAHWPSAHPAVGSCSAQGGGVDRPLADGPTAPSRSRRRVGGASPVEQQVCRSARCRRAPSYEMPFGRPRNRSKARGPGGFAFGALPLPPPPLLYRNGTERTAGGSFHEICLGASR